MQPIQEVMVAGLGAIGGAYALKFFNKPQINLRVLAGGERKKRYEAKGFQINGTQYQFQYADPAEPQPTPAQLIIVAVKDYGLKEVITEMAPFVGEDTLILSLMNGITSEERLGEAFGAEKVLYGICMGLDGFREGNVIRFQQYGTMSFGKADNVQWSPEVERVAALFDGMDIVYQVPQNMLYELWYKFMVNVGINQASAVVGQGFGAFQKIQDAHELMQDAMKEVLQITQKNGVKLTPADLDKWDAVLMGMPPESRPSMLNDLESGRQTEVEMLAGTVCRLGKELGVSTPVNQVLYQAIRAKEQATREGL